MINCDDVTAVTISSQLDSACKDDGDQLAVRCVDREGSQRVGMDITVPWSALYVSVAEREKESLLNAIMAFNCK